MGFEGDREQISELVKEIIEEKFGDLLEKDDTPEGNSGGNMSVEDLLEGKTVGEAIREKALELSEAEGIDREDAAVRIFDEHPELYQRYRDERGEG